MVAQGYYLEVWYGSGDVSTNLALSQYFGSDLESAIKNANKLAGCMLYGKGGSIVVSKKTQDNDGLIITEELLEI